MKWGMKDPAKTLGRPLLYSDRLERIQLLVTRQHRQAAEKEAAKRGVSVSQVYRDWMDKGRRAK